MSESSSDVNQGSRSNNGPIIIFFIVVCVLYIMATTPKGTSPKPATVKPQAQAAQSGSYTVTGPPSISAPFINTILCTWHSPTCGKGQTLYNLGIKYGIDPAYALAFFMNESTFGTAGMARITLGLGNERCIDDRPCVNGQGDPCQAGQSCYAQFESWEDGFEHWYMLIKNLYIGQWGLTTVPQIIHRYAPNADNNNEAHYAYVVEHAVDLWRAGKVALQ